MLEPQYQKGSCNVKNVNFRYFFFQKSLTLNKTEEKNYIYSRIH
jgi:hypothetical protein